MKIQSQNLEGAGGDTAEVDEGLDSIGHFGDQDQVLAIFILYARQITLRGLSDTGPGMGPEPVEKCSYQVIENFEADLDLEPVAVGKDHIPG